MKRAPLLGTLLFVSAVCQGSPVGTERIPLPEDILRLRDPFKRPVIQQDAVVKNPLQTYSLNSMKMVGILTGPLRMRAMIQTPDGKTHFVAENMLIGERNGVIRKITEDRIYIRERITNILGEVESLDTEIPLRSGNKETPPDASARPTARPEGPNAN